MDLFIHFSPDKSFSYDFKKKPYLIRYNLESYFKNQNVSCHKNFFYNSYSLFLFQQEKIFGTFKAAYGYTLLPM